MKKMIFVSAVLIALTACSSTDSDNDYSCNVTRNDKTVSMTMRYKDYGESRTVILGVNDKGTYVTYVKGETFPNADFAKDECEDEQEYSSDYERYVECHGNTVEITTFDYEDYDLDEYEYSYRKRCASYDKAVRDGDLEKKYIKAFE
jgi:hypothetical protein